MRWPVLPITTPSSTSQSTINASDGDKIGSVGPTTLRFGLRNMYGSVAPDPTLVPTQSEFSASIVCSA
ncbi:MAG: hypothetical protein Ct9H300mP12_16200 [Acidimicrobiales bacterium]|nr:MAG: hypothetical protein Ct9H300mP12_16200 [Acidimicrobiales bacterium]